MCQSPTKSSQGVTAQMPHHGRAATAGFAVATGTLGQWWALRAADRGGTEMRPHKRQTYRNWPHLDTENTMLVTQSHAILNE